jgi:hypothetical protein
MAAKEAQLDGRVARINTKLDESMQLDPARVREIAKEREHDRVFFSTLKRIEHNTEKGTYTPEPYEYLATGRVYRLPLLDEGQSPDLADYFTPMPTGWQRPEQSAGMRAMERRVEEMEQALAATSQTHGVSSAAEKEVERVPVQGPELERD